MRIILKVASLAAMGLMLPLLSVAQSVGGESGNDLKSMQQVLDKLYAEMMPLCSELIGVGRGIAGFAATWYIAARVWRHISNAEPIDFYPLLRPFAISMSVLMFPSVIALINGVMQPVVSGTANMVEGSDKAIATLLQQKEEAIKQTNAWQMYVGEDGSGDRDKWYQYTHPDDPDVSSEGMIEGI